jgi:YVTN family beta-propeller protein
LEEATTWVSFTELQQSDIRSDPSDGGLGIGDYYVYNPAVSTGVGGGWDCLNNALTVVANSSVASTAGIVTLVPGTASTSGTLYLRSKQSGQIIWQTNTLGLGSTMAATNGDLVYVSNRDAHTVSVINLQTKAIQTVSTGDSKPWIATVSPKDDTLYLVTESPSGYLLEGYTDASGLVSLTSSTDQITDLKADSEGRLVFLVQRAKETELHRFDPSTGREEIISLDLPANQLSLTEGGYLAYWTGEHHLVLVEKNSFRQTAKAVLPEPAFTSSAQYIGLSDGTIWEAKSATDAIQLTKVGTVAENERYSGFVPGASTDGHLLLYAVATDKYGKPSGALAMHNQ